MPDTPDYDKTQGFQTDSTRSLSLKPEMRVFRHYVLKRLLGMGGMGEVWLALDEQLNEQVALKFVLPSVRADERSCEQLKRETRLAHALTHPNIVRIHNYLEDEGFAAVSMEYVEGLSLDALQAREPNRVFETSKLAPWIEQLCSALDYAHRKVGVVHRDLKPKNLMIDRHGDLKVMDFGISAVISESTTRTSKHSASADTDGSGTLPYMSPQQHQQRKPKPSDDLYALGATLYELLTGNPPFFKGNIVQAAAQLVPPTMRERRKDYEVMGAPIPEIWEKTVAACLAKEEAQRPPDAKTVWERLSGKQSQRITRGDAPRGVRLNRSLIAAAVLVVSAGIGAWWLSLEYQKRERLAAEQAATRLQQERTALEAERKLGEQRAQQERERLDAAKRETERIERERQEAAAKLEAERLEATKRETLRQEAAKAEAARLEAERIADEEQKAKEARVAEERSRAEAIRLAEQQRLENERKAAQPKAAPQRDAEPARPGPEKAPVAGVVPEHIEIRKGPLRGVDLASHPPHRREFMLPDGVRGVCVRQVEGDSPAARAGLRTGDVIIEMNRTPTETIPALMRHNDEHAPGKCLLLLRRGRSQLYMAISP